MGAAGFHGRVREGIGWFTRAMDHRVGVTSLGFLGSPGGHGGSARMGRAGGWPGSHVSGEGDLDAITGRSLMWGRWLWVEEVDRAISTGQLQRVAALALPAYRRGGLPRL